MEEIKDKNEQLINNIIKQATEYANAIYPDNNEARIAAKGFAAGYQQAHTEKTIEIKELAGIIKLLLPGIGAVSLENLKIIEEYVEKSDKI
jgi:flagellar biosynthesis/type III secretory pathway protein FliH